MALKAVILCAGYGKRLEPYSKRYQKTMLPLHGKPILEYIINGLTYAGIKDIIMVVGYKKEQIMDYFKEGAKWGANIEYVEQRKLDGTGAALLLCEDLIANDHFFLTWGDILVPYEIYKKVCDLYRSERNKFILVANYTEDTSRGAAVLCQDNYCLDIIEKPPRGTIDSNLNNCGIFVLSTEIFKAIKMIKPSPRGEIELPQALSLGVRVMDWKIRVLIMSKDQFRGDMGNIEEYKKLKEDKNWLKGLISH
ncbi:MAG: nucleotidyltransferase family protein [Promethearchaeota archaeon]|nr:MAG: nucleotidyltransferase family protein [Candidatus Lokiarchaeota archaeon]